MGRRTVLAVGSTLQQPLSIYCVRLVKLESRTIIAKRYGDTAVDDVFMTVTHRLPRPPPSEYHT